MCRPEGGSSVCVRMCDSAGGMMGWGARCGFGVGLFGLVWI